MRNQDRHYRAHPWHGVYIGKKAPQEIRCYIEIVPTDTVKYELDKDSGILRVDRPQRFSNICPALYGLIPQTYCGKRIAQFCMDKSGKTGIEGDSDPLDILVLCETNLTKGNVLVDVIPIGGFRMLDGNEADDKIVAVLKGDVYYGKIQDISECQDSTIQRLKHYFLTYKQAPDNPNLVCEITHVYDHKEAHEVIRLSQEDYKDLYFQQ